MPQPKIMSVGIAIPSDDIEFVEIDSKRSLLDGDIILFAPRLSLYSSEMYQGKICLDDERSVRFHESAAHWHSQISGAVAAGRTVVITLSERQDFFVGTGGESYSGSGRSRVKQRHVRIANNYELLPIRFASLTGAVGERFSRVKSLKPIEEYWRIMAEHSKYAVIFTSDTIAPLLKTVDGKKIIAGVLLNNGAAVLVPKFEVSNECWDDDYEESDWDDYDEEAGDEAPSPYTKEGKVLGAKVLKALLAIHGELSGGSKTLAPEWTRSEEYRLAEEDLFESKILRASERLDELQRDIQQQKDALLEYVKLKDLLYESGDHLENAVKLGLRELGYSVSSVRDGNSEFDVVFEVDGERFLGEVEGRDSKPIAVEKISQLERNINEDFERDDVEKYAHGVLFGNPFRTKPVGERADPFTAKVLQAAERAGTRLICTADLYRAVQHFRQSKDATFAAACRQAILNQKGGVVKFPIPPIQTAEKKEPVLSSDKGST